VLAGVAIALLLATFILGRIQTDKYLLTVDTAHALAPFVHVQGAHPAGTGELFFVDVNEIHASELDLLLRSWLHPHSTEVKAKVIVPHGTTSQQQLEAGYREMATSQQIATAATLQRLGYHVIGPKDGVFVDNVYSNVPAAAKVFPADVIVAANGKPTRTPAALHTAVAPVKPGQVVSLRIRRGSKTVVENVKTIHDPNGGKTALIGILVEQDAKIKKLPIKVSINLAGIGGPSAGLPFALEVMRKLGTDVTHGYKVAATGQIHLDGTISAIGGVEQKTWGARDAGAQVFLVPVDGHNAKDARKYAGSNLKIIPVTSLKQALRALAALPKLPKE
jgi:PDZ domain-containing protein